MTSSPVISIARAARRRALFAGVIRRMGEGIALGCAAALVGIITSRLAGSALTSESWWWGWRGVLVGSALIGAAVGAVVAWSGRWSLHRAAGEIDARLKTHDGLRIALEIGEARDPFAQLTRARAEALAQRADSRIVADPAVAFRGRGWIGAAGLVLAATAAGIWWPVRVPKLKPAPPMVLADSEQAVVREAVAQATHAAERLPEFSPSDRALLESLEQELASGQAPAESRLRAAQAVERVAETLEEQARAERRADDVLRRDLAERAAATREAAASELAKAISRADLPAAARAAETLRETARSLPSAEREKLAAELEQLAEALEAQESSTKPAESTRPDEQADSESQGQDRPNPPEQTPEVPPVQPEKAAEPDVGEHPSGPSASPADLPRAEGSRDQLEQLREAARRAADELRQQEPQPSVREPRDPPGTPANPPGGAQSPTPPSSPDKPATPGTPNQPSTRPSNGARNDAPSVQPRDGQTQREPSTPNNSDQRAPERTGQPAGEGRDESRPSEQPSTEPKSDPRSQGSGDATSAPSTKQPPGQKPPNGQRAAETPTDSTKPPTDPSRQDQTGDGRPSTGERADPTPTGSKQPGNDQKPPQVPSESVRPEAGGAAQRRPDGSQPQPGDQAPKQGADPQGDAPAAPAGMPNSGTKQSAPQARPSTDPNRAPPSQPSDPARGASGGEGQKPSDQQTPGTPRDSATPPPGGASKSDSMPSSPQGSPPNPGEMPPGGVPPGGLDKLAETLKNMSRRAEGAEQSEQEARRLREQARQLMDRMSTQQKRELEQLARQLGESPSGRMIDNAGTGKGPMSAPRATGPRPDLDTMPTELVDARPRDTAQPSAHDRVLAEWEAPPRDGGPPPVAGGLSEGVRRAAEGVERAIEQQQVPPRYNDLVRRVFKKYVDRAQPSEAAPK